MLVCKNPNGENTLFFIRKFYQKLQSAILTTLCHSQEFLIEKESRSHPVRRKTFHTHLSSMNTIKTFLWPHEYNLRGDYSQIYRNSVSTFASLFCNVDQIFDGF